MVNDRACPSIASINGSSPLSFGLIPGAGLIGGQGREMIDPLPTSEPRKGLARGDDDREAWNVCEKTKYARCFRLVRFNETFDIVKNCECAGFTATVSDCGLRIVVGRLGFEPQFACQKNEDVERVAASFKSDKNPPLTKFLNSVDIISGRDRD